MLVKKNTIDVAQTQTRQTIKDILRMGLLTIAPFDGSPM
jgi:hypothetical protein